MFKIDLMFKITSYSLWYQGRITIVLRLVSFRINLTSCERPWGCSDFGIIFYTSSGADWYILQCGAHFILWFNEPIWKSFPVLRPSCVAHTLSPVNCKKAISLPIFPERKGIEHSINHLDGDASMVTKKSASIYAKVGRHAFPSSSGTCNLHIPLSAY